MWFAGLNVHHVATVITVRNGKGAILRRATIPTTAAALKQFFKSVRGRGKIVIESSALAAWAARTLSTRMREVIVGDARKTHLLAAGAKHDRMDADKLSELLRLDAISPVYIGDIATQELRQLVVASHDVVQV